MSIVAARRGASERLAGSDRPGTTALSGPLRASALAAGRMLQLYARIVGKRARCRWTDSRGRVLSDEDLLGAFGCLGGTAPAIVVYWIRDAMAVVALPYARPAFRRIVEHIRLLPDDTISGRACAAYFQNIGGQFHLLALPGDHDRLRQLAKIIREPISCAFPVDGGGPYGRVGTGLVGLAAAIGARIVPISVWATPAIIAAPRSRVRIPLPSCRLVGVVADEIVVDRHSNRRLVAEQVRESLNNLGEIARTSSRDV